VWFHEGTSSGPHLIRVRLILFVAPEPNWTSPATVLTSDNPPSLRTFPF
jgi:hypothetical protein